jgi:uncharacterized protein
MKKSEQKVIDSTAAFVRKKFEGENTGHDWWHMYRVWQLARHIGKSEKADMLVVELGALLHDIADWKFHDDEEGPHAARQWLESQGVDNAIVEHIEDIIRNVSFKGAKVKNVLTTLEGRVIYDADKLDALGAVGIARTFVYSGANKRALHNPDQGRIVQDTPDGIKYDQGDTINHFYDKLLILKDRMLTKTGRQTAQHRHEFMEQFLEEFYAEWDGKL